MKSSRRQDTPPARFIGSRHIVHMSLSIASSLSSPAPLPFPPSSGRMHHFCINNTKRTSSGRSSRRWTAPGIASICRRRRSRTTPPRGRKPSTTPSRSWSNRRALSSFYPPPCRFKLWPGHAVDTLSMASQGLRITNMELLVKHGGNVWLAHNRSVEAAIRQCADSPPLRAPASSPWLSSCCPPQCCAMTRILSAWVLGCLRRVQKDNAALRKEIDDLNKTRKMQQASTSHGHQLRPPPRMPSRRGVKAPSRFPLSLPLPVADCCRGGDFPPRPRLVRCRREEQGDRRRVQGDRGGDKGTWRGHSRGCEGARAGGGGDGCGNGGIADVATY